MTDDSSNGTLDAISRRQALKSGAVGAGGVLGLGAVGTAATASDTSLGTVDLPEHGACAAAGTYTGTYYLTLGGPDCYGTNRVQVYEPPADGSGTATQVADKRVYWEREDDDPEPIPLSVLEWDPKRNAVWGGFEDDVWLVDLGDPTLDGHANATPRWEADVTRHLGEDFEGIARDARDDTLYLTTGPRTIPESQRDDDCVYHFRPDGTRIGTVKPKGSDGNAGGYVTGLTVGADLSDGTGTLFVGRHYLDEKDEIHRVRADDGAYLSTVARTDDRVGGLSCHPSFGGTPAILAKSTHDGYYAAFEVDAGAVRCADSSASTERSVSGVGRTLRRSGLTDLLGL